MDLYNNKKALGELSSLYMQMNESSYLETDMEKRRKNNEKAVEDMKKTKAHKDMTKAARKAMGIDEGEDREYRKMLAKERQSEREREAKRPGVKSITPGKKAASAGKDYADYQSKSIESHDKVTKKAKHTVGNPFPEEVQYVGEAKKGKKPNDGNLANNYPPYDKVTRGDVIAGRLGKDEMGGKRKVKEAKGYYDPMDDDDFDHDEAEENRGVSGKNNPKGGKSLGKKRKAVKEGFSDWRQDLSEILDTEDEKQIKEKKVKNKVIIDPDLKLESIAHELGAEIIEVIELDEGSLKPGETYMQYAKRKQAERSGAADKRMTVTVADKKANTPAYQKYRAGDKRYKMVGEDAEVEPIEEKALSRAQQRFMGMVYAAKKGETPASPEVAKAASGMSKKAAKDFAGTKHKGLPEKKVAKEETEIEEGMTMKDFKKQRSRQKQKEKRAAEKTSPLRRAGIHADKASPERAARHRANVDPDFEGNDERNYPGGKLKNPKKIRKAKAMGELGEEALTERRKEDKVAGTPRKPRDRAYEIVRGTMRKMEGTPKGQQKKVPGKKPPVAGQYGAPKSPAQKVALRRRDRQRSQDNMSSRFD